MVRNAMRRISAVLLTMSLFAAIGCGSDDDDGGNNIQQGTLIELGDGMLQGTVDGGSRRFLGIPFAAPPVGELRWRPPQPPQPWTGVLQADAISPACAQQVALTTPASDSEDCLYLNVWAPNPAPPEPLPVMLWIHGGGNSNGSTGDEIPLGVGGLFYNGRSLAEERGVVVVTTNYRLNVFGFFSHSGLAAEDPQYPYSGNQGLLDQRAAMQWVRDNIAAFGGDPENVTIFGESAGAFNVCYQLVSPGSRGLFHRAISQSGGCTFRQPTDPEARELSDELIDSVGCLDAADPLACLRDVPVAELLEGSAPFGPSVDGGVLPDQPRVLFDSGEFARVPYIAGSNLDEGTLFAIGAPQVSDEDEYRALLEERFGDRAAEAEALYPVSEFDSPNDAWVRINGDEELVCETYDSARRAAARGADVYLYNFSRAVLTDILPDLGATHGAEIAFVFGSAESPTPEDMAISVSMQGYWSRFARAGDPNGDGVLVWPEYSDEVDQRIDFDVENSILTGFRREQCEFFWSLADEEF